MQDPIRSAAWLEADLRTTLAAMTPTSRRRLAALLLVAAWSTASSSDTGGQATSGTRAISADLGSQPSAPRVSAADQRYLTQAARRSLEQHVRGDGVYVPSYVPSSLAGEVAGCVVTIRLHGRVLGGGAAAAGPALEACGRAAFAAIDKVAETQPVDLDLLDQVLLGIEVLGVPVELALPDDFTNIEALDRFVEPGVDGVILTVGGRTKQFLPSEIVNQNVTVSDAMLSLAEQVTTSKAELAGATISCFRTCEWYEHTPGGRVVELRRGMTFVEPDQVTRAALTLAAERLSDYLVRRQRMDGLFGYQYEPSLDRFTDAEDLAHQAGATWALSAYARSTDRNSVRAAALTALRSLADRSTDLPSEPGVAFVAGPDHENEAGVTAASVLAMIDHPDRALFADRRDRLISGLLWLQQDDGRFLTAFPPARHLPGQTVQPGLVLLAVARAYDLRPRADILASFDTALPFYRRLFRSEPDSAFCVWQMQAFAAMARQTNRRDYAEFTFEMADWLLRFQLDEGNCSYPELRGGFATHGPGRAGVSTAAYLGGIADAFELARHRHDSARSTAYERALRNGVRFVLQLQVRPEEAYYSLTPSEVVWGVRAAPTKNLLRIDSCHHALTALTKTINVLYPESDSGP